MASTFPYEVIEKIVESLMWGLQERLEGKEEDDAVMGAVNAHKNDKSGSSEDAENEAKVAATRNILREYAKIPLVSRSFRQAYLRFFTTLPALSYDAPRSYDSRGEVRLYSQQPPPSSSSSETATTFPYIVAEPGVIRMLAESGRLGHLKWVHITTTLRKSLLYVLGASPLECLYQVLNIEHPLTLMERCLRWTRDDVEWVLLNMLGLNATSLHIGFTVDCLMATNADDCIPPVTFSFVSREVDFSRTTRFTLSAKVQETWLFTSSSKDWAVLIDRVLGMCSGCRELRWEFTQDDGVPWDCSCAVRKMAEGVLPAILQSDASILIHYNFALNFEDEKTRRYFFEEVEELFSFGNLVAEVGK